jgi:hypothetical protein
VFSINRTVLEVHLKRKIQISLIFSAFVLLLAACSGQSEDIPTAQPELSSEIAPAEENEATRATATPVAQATAAPIAQATASQDDALEPTSIPEPTLEPAQEIQNIAPAGFENYEADAFGLQLVHPESWLVTEDPELGLILESVEGYFETIPDAEGAGMIIYPRDELAGEEIIEALRLSVFDFAPPPSIFIDYPTVSMIGEHDIAIATFQERDSGIEGFYTFIQNGDHGVFVFAAATGLVMDDFLIILEDVIGTVNLVDSGASS